MRLHTNYGAQLAAHLHTWQIHIKRCAQFILCLYHLTINTILLFLLARYILRTKIRHPVFVLPTQPMQLHTKIRCPILSFTYATHAIAHQNTAPSFMFCLRYPRNYTPKYGAQFYASPTQPMQINTKARAQFYLLHAVLYNCILCYWAIIILKKQ